MIFLTGKAHKIALGVIVALFTGCTHTVTVIKPQLVNVPVPVPCAPAVPSEPVWEATGKLKGNHAAKAKAMAQDLDSAHAYIGTLEAALKACQ